MGCCNSILEREEMVLTCKSRKRFIKLLVQARQALSLSLAMYFPSLRATGSALLRFSTAEASLRPHQHPPALPLPLPPPPPMSPISDTSITSSSPLPPPPPPPPQSSSWEFWDPFMLPPPPSAVVEEQWEEVAAITGGNELAMVVSRNGEDLMEIFKQVDECFLKAADAGDHLSLLFQVPNSNLSATHTHNNGGKVDDHCSTLERLYAWEKKLLEEVKNAESIKIEHEKKVGLVRKVEVKRSEHAKSEKAKKEVEKLESEMKVATQAIETTCAEIFKLRDEELYPQLVDLVKGLMCMWRSMYEAHKVQAHVVQQLRYLNTIPSAEPTSEIHGQYTLQLELEVQRWQLSFCNLVKAQRDYIQSLTGWLRLSLFQFNDKPLSGMSQESRIYSLCEEWHHVIHRIPDKVASEGIKSLLTLIHAIEVQQGEEHKQKKKSESAFKELDKKTSELRSLETKYGSMPDTSMNAKSKDPIAEKRAKVEILRAKAEEERFKHEKSVRNTRAITINSLQMGFPQAFEAMVGFSSICMEAFESIYKQAKRADVENDVKRILPEEGIKI